MHSMQQQYTYKLSLYARADHRPTPRCRTLYSGEGVSITEHDVGAPGASCPLEATSMGHRLLITRRGAGLVRRRTVFGTALTAEPLQAIVLEAGVGYLLEPVNAAHWFTVFTFDPELAASIVPSGGGGGATSVVVAAHALVDSRLLMAFHRLRRALGARDARIDHYQSSVEGDALALLRAVCDGNSTRAVMASRRAEQGRIFAGRRRHEIVERVKCMLASAPEAAHPLDGLSAPLGISTSLLAHVFPQETGFSPHRYLLHLRSALALAALSAGGRDLSRVALDLGFATHSHFSAAFRRCTGMTPSEARLALASPDSATRPRIASTTSLVRCAHV